MTKVWHLILLISCLQIVGWIHVWIFLYLSHIYFVLVKYSFDWDHLKSIRLIKHSALTILLVPKKWHVADTSFTWQQFLVTGPSGGHYAAFFTSMSVDHKKAPAVSLVRFKPRTILCEATLRSFKSHPNTVITHIVWLSVQVLFLIFFFLFVSLSSSGPSWAVPTSVEYLSDLTCQGRGGEKDSLSNKRSVSKFIQRCWASAHPHNTFWRTHDGPWSPQCGSFDFHLNCLAFIFW